MEKRFVLFIVLSLGVLTTYALVKSMIAPNRPAIVKQQKGKPQQAPEGQDGATPVVPGSESEDQGTPDQPTIKADPGAEDTVPSATAQEPVAGSDATRSPDAADDAGGPIPQQPDAWFSLGSYQPGEGPPILVTWNARGATVERIELTARDGNGKLLYRELINRSGYLGHLALRPDPAGGCRVNVVGQGTPAATAANPTSPGLPGLQIGDVIHHVDGVSTPTPASLKEFLDKTRPGQAIRLAVRRPKGDAATDLQLTATLDVHPLQLIQPERPIGAKASVPVQPSSFLFSLIQLDDAKAAKGTRELNLGVSARNDNWQMIPLENGRGVEFRLQVDAASGEGAPAKFELVKRFRLGAPGNGSEPQAPYHLDYDIEIRNLSDQPHRIAYRQDGPNGLPLEGWWYSNKIHPTMFYVAGARDVVWKTETRSASDDDPQARPEVIRTFDHELVGCSEINKTATKAETSNKSPETVLFATDVDEPGDRMPLYVAVDTQYFLTALKPVSQDQVVYDLAAAYVLGNVDDIPKAAKKSTNVSFHLDSHAQTIDGNAALTQSFVVYAGPKVPEVLAVYDLQDCIYYGWFGTVSKLLALVLHFFFAMVKNYGLAIIMLTVLVRGGMFPLSRKAAKNAAMMQALAPQMKKITEKYKEDMEKRAKAQQELFKKHNYNPLGGCWMMFLQLPIFIGLYRCLSVDINLRQASLIPGITWCSNLAGPDMLFSWPERFSWSMFTELGMLGPYFNILPMFTVVLFLVQQKLFTPPPTDDQTRMQATMMKYMTVFIGVMFFKVAAGLCLYFIASSLWGIAERKLLPKPKLAADGGPVSEPAPLKANPRQPRPKPKLPENGKPGRQQPRAKKKRR